MSEEEVKAYEAAIERLRYPVMTPRFAADLEGLRREVQLARDARMAAVRR